MAIFGIELQGTEEENRVGDILMEDIMENFENPNVVSNPFIAKVINQDDMYAIYMKPIYFNFTIFGWLGLLIMFATMGWTWFLILPFIIGACHIFWSGTFYYYMLKISLMKRGYKGKMRRLTKNQILEEFVFNL